MPSTVLVGAQWGDEGKGKITDLIAREFDYVVRFQGGNNAGHTVIHGDKKLALHLMPSGVMYENAVPVIGNGVIIDPGVLVKEMAMLEAEGISCSRLKISCDAHVIMPYHKDLDGADEKRLGKNQIGTTKRGIGPCYQDKAARKGIRIQDLLDEKIFRLKVETALAQKNPILEKIYGLHTYTVEEICEEYLPYARILKPYMDETAQLLNNALRDGKNILFEGAQGTLLDIDHGTYPYVTSSSCCAGGAATGTGVARRPSIACWAFRRRTLLASAAVPSPPSFCSPRTAARVRTPLTARRCAASVMSSASPRVASAAVVGSTRSSPAMPPR